MGDIIRQLTENAKVTKEVRLEAIEKAIPQSEVEEVVRKYRLSRQRDRKLSAEMGIWLIILMNLCSHLSLGQVAHKLIQGLRLVMLKTEIIPASKGAVCQLRYQIGAKPIVELFRRVCKPMTIVDTPGAFLFGLRLMAIDGADEMIPDTPANEKAFGRHGGRMGEAGYPQLKAVYLEEVGSHAIIDAGFWPTHTSEREGGYRMLRSIEAGMLLMWDAGFHSIEMVKKTLDRRAHFVGRLPANRQLVEVQRLPDGSHWVYLAQRDHKGNILEKIPLRMIKYSLTDPAMPGFGEHRRLITSLLDWQHCPALEIAWAYHQRWEIEITIDEMDTHQRLAFHPLRSQKPVGVIQELYGLLIAHYAIRKIMLDAANLAGLDPDRMSFINSLRLVGEALHEFQTIDRQYHPLLYQRLLKDIARFYLPPRKTRTNPRVVKRTMSPFLRKRSHHLLWPQPRLSFREAVAILN